MNEVEKKEIEEMVKIFCDEEICSSKQECNKCEFRNYYPCGIVKRLNALKENGYGKVEDYKKETATYKGMVESATEIIDKQKKEIERLKEENEKLFERNKTLLNTLKEVENIAKDFVSEDNKLKIANEIADMIKEEIQQAIKEFCERLKINAIYLPYCEIKVLNIEYIDDLLKEYGIGEE